MHIAIGADQGGFELKQKIVEYLIDQEYQVIDLGIHELKSVDYPDIAESVARAVADDEVERGIIICATGIGVSMAANKIRGIRAALCTDCYMARMAREHNNAQVLCLGGRVIGVGLALDIVDAFLGTKAQGGRHARRVEKINALEDNEEG